MKSSLSVWGYVREETAERDLLWHSQCPSHTNVQEDASWTQGLKRVMNQMATDYRIRIFLVGFCDDCKIRLKKKEQQRLSSNCIWQNNDLYSILHQRKYKCEGKPHRHFNNSWLERKLPLPVHRSVTFIPKSRLRGSKRRVQGSSPIAELWRRLFYTVHVGTEKFCTVCG